MITPPKIKEIKEFQFKLHSRLRVFHGSANSSLFHNNVNVLSASSRYGLLFAGYPSGFKAIDTSSLQVSGSTEQKEYVHRNVELGSKPSYLSVNADETLLAVVIEIASGSLAIIYDLHSLTSQHVVIKYQLRLTESPGVSVQDLQWNPAIPNLLCFIYSDGSVCLYELKGGPFSFNSLPQSTLATCHSWSPKGKQIVIGSSNGTMVQYKPDLKAVKTVAAPSFIQNPSVVNIHWLSSFQFCAVYKDAGNPDERPSIVIVNTPKNEPVQFINYEDICFSMGTIRPPQYYIIHQQTWNILLVSSANSMEVGVLAADSKAWVPWSQIDEGRAELPADPTTKNETYPVGFTLDLSSVQPIPWGLENQVIPPMPLLALLSHTGVLCLFHIVNLLPTFVPICSPPEPLADKSALQYASVPAQESEPGNVVHQAISIPQPTFTQVSPMKQVAPVGETQNFSTATQLTPQQDQSFSFSTPTKSVSGPKKLDFSFEQNNSLSVSQQIKPSDISGINLISEKPPVAPVPSFEPVSPRPEPATDQSEPEKLRNMKAMKSRANNEMYTAAVFDEIARFEAELKDFKDSASKLDITVGIEEEKIELKKNVDCLENFYKELTETTNSLNLEVDSLKTVLMEAFSWIEDAKARKTQLHHPGYQNVVRLQELDPVSLQRLKSIHSNVYYVESQLKQANSQLDSQWGDLQNALTQNKSNMTIPTLENVYQTMVVQKNTLNELHSKIDGLSSKIKVLQNDKPFILMSNTSESMNGDSELSKLAESLIKVKLNHTGKSRNPCLEAKRHLIMLARKQMLSAIKEAKLKELQNIHTPPRIKPAKLKVANGALFGSCNVLPLPLPTSNEIIVKEPSLKSANSFSQTAETQFLESTPDSFKLPLKDQPLFQNVLSQSKPNIENSSIFGPPQVEKDKVVLGTNFSIGKLDTVGFISKPDSSHQSSVPVANQFSFKSPAAPTSMISSAAAIPKSILSSSASVTNQAQNKSVASFSVSSTDENKAKEIVTAKPDSTTALKSSIFGNGDLKTNVPFAAPLYPKLDDSAPAKDTASTKEISSAGQLNFGTLSFGTSATATTKSGAVSIFGGSAVSQTFNMFGEKSVEPIKNSKVPSDAGTLATTNTESPKSITVITSPAISSSSLPISTVVTGSSIEPTSISSTPSGAPFSFGVSKPITTTLNASEASKNDTPISKFSFGASVPAATVTAASSTGAFSFASAVKPISVSAPSTVPFSGLNLTVSSTSTPTRESNSVFSFSNTPTLEASSAPASTAETRPAFSFGQALTTPDGQNTFGSFSFGNLKSQVSIFGGQCKPAETTTSSETATSDASTVSTIATTTNADSAATSTASLFGGLSVSAPSKPIFGSTPATTSSVFGSPVTVATGTTVFGTSTSTTSGSIFGSPTTTSAPSLFGSPSGTVFGQATSVASTQATNVFGQAAVVASTPPQTPGVFGQITSAISTAAQSPSIFSQATSVISSVPQSPSVFGQATSVASTTPQTPSVFGHTTTVAPTSPQTPNQTPSVFAQATSVASTTPQTQSVFGQVTSVAPTTLQTPNLFARTQTTTASSSLFGNAPTPVVSNTFGQSSPVSSKPSSFGSATNLFATSSTTTTSIFSSPNVVTTTAANTGLFGSPTTTASVSTSSFFGQAICSPNSTPSNTGSVFGQSPSVFGQTATAGTPVFGSPPLFGGKATFGQSGGSLFGNSSSSFGPTTGTSVFGSPSNTSALGSSTATSPVFGQSPGANTSGSIFGNTSGGSFSTGLNQPFGQPSFAATASSFQNKPASGFGASPTFGGAPSFGATNPAFGAPPAFGSQPSVFGSASPTNAFGGGMANQSSPTNATFENLAKQNTVSFGNLAQNQAPSGFGNTNIFGGSPQNPNAFQKQTPPQFGGSSFSSWR